MKTLLITRPIAEPVMEKARAAFDVTVHEGGALSEAECAAALASYDCILPTLGDAFTQASFAGDIRCKMLGNFGVGYNHIDDAAAAAAGVIVSNTPDVLTDATADIALTLLLATARRAGEGERMVRSGAWGGFDVKGLLGTHVTGKTLGVIGMGRIGQAIAARCHYGFGMDVVFHNRSPKVTEVPARQLESLEAVMETADFVVVATPGGAGTTKLIDAAALAAMKPTGIFINISRGEVVDEAALIDVLEKGAITGAGLDVYENEPHVPERLMALDNCVLLPHLGSATQETRQAMGQMALDNIIAWSQGKTPPQQVN
ncbi:D-glycerate dehydrogenase [Octadecabacter sp. 1_MG-2023]|uniref:2-hydroxyacid dehydrogenase n=1 Tax=unclassified Octadecabacter TaxID=196158 RepID=UPI001C0A177A|nr:MULTISPECIES: D-glycerate dehydrogenase [unclassified Octadecabacter]MBU2994647.1 D-glycerate dehydrogenase [Octadecabacter sp. B2R22]MDO6734060.1 D-glycerate dehydrogenase [Octadecabacter sp. 1_MG-2023]